MFEHRLREFFASSEQAVAVATAVEAAPAFVPCPCSLLASYTPNQVSFVAEVYRLAREMTEAQLRKPARVWPPAFSAN